VKSISTTRRKEALNLSIGVKNDVGRARQQDRTWAETVNVTMLGNDNNNKK